MECEYCGAAVTLNSPGVQQFVSGWSPVARLSRNGEGGMHRLNKRELHARFKCAGCATAHKYGADDQQTLFADEAILGFPKVVAS